jgi:hypothetical protein
MSPSFRKSFSSSRKFFPALAGERDFFMTEKKYEGRGSHIFLKA